MTKSPDDRTGPGDTERSPHPPSAVSAVTVKHDLVALLGALPPRRRRSMIRVAVLTVTSSFAEILMVATIIPLLTVLMDPERPAAGLPGPLTKWLEVGSSESAITIFGSIFIAAAIISTVLRLATLSATQKFTHGAAHEISMRIFSDTLRQPYAYHVAHNSSESLSMLGQVDTLALGMIAPMVNGLASAVVMVAVAAALLILSPVIALVSVSTFLIVYLLASRISRQGLRRHGAIVAETQADRVRTVQEGLGGIRDIILDGSHDVFVGEYARYDVPYRRAYTKIPVYSVAPRYLIEGVSTALVAAIAIAIASGSSSDLSELPLLGAFAIAAQRLLPSAQQVYMGWAAVVGYRATLRQVVEVLQRGVPAAGQRDEPMAFEVSLVLDGVDFNYSDERERVLRGVNLVIPKGSRVGIAGPTGGGKSTLADILLGLLQPSAGVVAVDGAPLTPANVASWRNRVAHVPQHIFLADSTIAENIAFGQPTDEIERDRVAVAATRAGLGDVIGNLPSGLDTPVGEGGFQLSGGQRQRVGIARALYKEADVIVFDEATSALDSATESLVMQGIAELDDSLTLVIIAHRLTTLEVCDFVAWVDKGEIARVEQNHHGRP